MNTLILFTVGLAAIVAVAALTLAYLKQPLNQILMALCGNEQRAAFWSTFTHVTVALAAAVCVLQAYPEAETVQPDLLIVRELKWGCSGILISVAIVGFVLSRWIVRRETAPLLHRPASLPDAGGAR